MRVEEEDGAGGAALDELEIVDAATTFDACWEDAKAVVVPAVSIEVLLEKTLLAHPARNMKRRMPFSILHVQEERLVFSRCLDCVTSDLLVYLTYYSIL